MFAPLRLMAQTDPGQRLTEMERALETERNRNDAQARRIEELELTIASLVAHQDQIRAEAVTSAALESEVEAAIGRQLPTRTSKSASGRDLVTFSGQGRFVIRAFDGDEISTDQSFEVEHLILQIQANLDDQWRLKLTPGSSHTGAVFILEAYAGYKPFDFLEIQAGRFLVPFNGVHAWAYPSDSFLEPYLAENAPRPFLYPPWWDEGVMVSGNIPFGTEGEHQFYYAAYVINGFDALGLDGVHKRTIGDNNENKTLGARLSATFRLGEATRLVIGAAGLTGKYDSFDDLRFFALEADVEFQTGPFSIYLEAFHRPTEVEAGVAENPAAEVIDVSRLTGFKVRPQWRFLEGFTLFAQFDHLMVRQPERTNGLFSVFALDDESFGISTLDVGVKIDVGAHFRVVIEGGIFDRDHDLGDDIRFVALSLYSWF